jgi:endonuclease III
MPTIVTLPDNPTDPNQVSDQLPKIRISQNRLMEAFGGKSFYGTDFLAGDEDDCDDDDDELSASTIQVKEVIPLFKITTNSGATVSSVSTVSTNSRRFPRKAKGKESVVKINEEELVDGYSCPNSTANIPSPTPTHPSTPGDTPTTNTKETKKKSPPKTKRTYKKKQKTVVSTSVKDTQSSNSTASTRTARGKKLLSSLIPDGTMSGWEIFIEGGGYSLTVDEKERVRNFVRAKQRNTVFVSEAVKFHMLVRDMRKEILVESARDAWTLVLPHKSSDNFNFCCLFLMIATPNTPDEKIIEVFGPLFEKNYVTAQWVLEMGVEGIAKSLRVLGRQNMTAKYIFTISEKWMGLSRNYRSLMELPGVGAKVALVTVAECYNLSQGVPCDVHMVRIFKALSWMPITLDEDCLMDMDNEKKGKKDDEYELARASIEGWFPPLFWPDLNQTYAGLGQLLRIDESRKTILNYVDREARNWNSKWRLTDLRAIRSLVQAYQS